MAQDRYTCLSGGSVRVGRFSTPVVAPAPTYTDYLVFSEGTQGTTFEAFNRVGGLYWQNQPDGDWIDANQVPQGSEPVAFAPAAVGLVEMDVTPFMTRWRTVVNDGLFLRPGSDTASARYRSKEYAVPGERPELLVVTDNGSYSCPVLRDTYIHKSSNTGLGGLDRFTAGSVLIQFDLSSIPVADVVSSATMRLYGSAIFGGNHNLHAYYINAPRPFDVGKTPRTDGIAAAVGPGGDLSAHPDVWATWDWSGDWFNHPEFPFDPRWDPEQPDPVQEVFPDGDTWLRFWMPTDPTATGQGEGTGFTVTWQIMPVPESIAPIPQTAMGPEHIFCRYSMKLDENWTGLNDPQLTGGKFPGLSGRYGEPKSFGGRRYWQARVDGGVPGLGIYAPAGTYTNTDHFKGWTTRVLWESRAYQQTDNNMSRTFPVGNYRYYPEFLQSGTGEPTLWANAQFEADREYDIEQEVQMNTVDLSNADQYGNGTGNPDGVLRVWLNGVLVWEETDVIWRHHPALAIDQWWGTFKNGGTISPVLPRSAWVGRVVIATSYIGPRP